MLLILLSSFYIRSIIADSTGIGQGFFLPNLPLIEDNGFGKSVFKTIPPECIQSVPSDLNREEKTYFEDTQSFYAKLGIETSLSGEITDGFTLGASIVAASNSIDSTKLQVKGMSYDVYAMTGFWQIIPDCLTSMELADDFTRNFESLPDKIDDPTESSEWYEYETFLQTYGSHITKRISHGSKLTRYVFSKSSEKISQLDFLTKVCATLKDVNLTYCANFTAQDYARVAHLATSEELTVRGGSSDTRAALMTNVTNALVKKFLTEASLTEQPISVQYVNVWELLKRRYLGTEHFRKAINIQSYYLGYLNMGCSKKDDAGIELRRFVLAEDHPDVPQYECQLAPEGCRGDNDCHIGGAGSTCYCYGNGCVDHRTVEDPRHVLQEERYVKRNYDGSSSWSGVNWSCHYHIGIYCVCDKSWGGSWKTVWPDERHRSELELYKQAYKLRKFFCN